MTFFMTWLTAVVAATLLIVTSNCAQRPASSSVENENPEDYSELDGRTLISEGKEERRKKIRYLLRKQKGDGYDVIARDGSNAAEHFVKSGTLKILIHGFTFQVDETVEKRISHSYFFDLADEYQRQGKMGDKNVIVLDWTELSTAHLLHYPDAADSTSYAGKDVAEFIIKMQKLGLVSLEKVHIIGFSLGAHVAGVAGNTVLQATGAKVGRITGLDPAGPLFTIGPAFKLHRDYVLDRKDARFVDVIHCDLGVEGTAAELGHADFYPNGGINQPSCAFVVDTYCNHHTCPQYYIRTVQNGRVYPSRKCATLLHFTLGRCKEEEYMGEDVTRRAGGKYYLDADL